MPPEFVVVDGIVPVEASDLDDVRASVWSYAMDQRVFGPRKLMVAFTDADGRLRILAIADRTSTPLTALEACLLHLGAGAAAAVAFCDEPVASGPMPAAFVQRFEEARELCMSYGVHLIDWIACDDDKFRAARLRTLDLSAEADWWDSGAV